MSESREANLHFLDYWSVIKYRWAIILIVFLLVTGAAGLTCYFLPREYFSKVLMEVKPDGNALRIFNPEAGLGSRTGGATLSPTQFQILHSKEILYPVIEQLKLREAWGGGEVLPLERTYYMLLRKMGDTRELRNTDMIQLGVYANDPEEAANIANAIANTYEKARRDEEISIRDVGLKQFKDTLEQSRLAVTEARNEMIRIRTEDGIIDLNPETSEPMQSPEGHSVQSGEADVAAIKAKVAELRVQLAEISKLSQGELMTSLHHLNIEDPTIAKILPLYQESVVAEAGLLNSGLGPNHPNVKALRAQKDVYAEQLVQQIKALRSAIETRLSVAEGTMAALGDTKEEARATFSDSRKKALRYTIAKEEYLNRKRVQDAAEANFNTQMMQNQMSVFPVKIWEKAEPSAFPAKPHVIVFMAIAVVGGLILGVGLAFFLEYLDTSVRTVDEVENLLRIPVLGVIPKGVGSLVAQDGETPDVEAYRILQTNLDLNRRGSSANTITLISGGVGEGKSTTLNNLAYTYAKAGYSVLVVDADLRRSSQHTFFGVDKNIGLADILSGTCRIADAVRQTQVPNLWFIPAGSSEATARASLNSNQLADFIAEVKSHYDFVFFDSPPILGLSDASVLTSLCDLTLMVIQYRRFPRAMLERVRISVLQSQGNLIGAVLNNVDYQRDTNYQYYTQYYTYYRQPERAPKKEASKPASAGKQESRKAVASTPDEY